MTGAKAFRQKGTGRARAGALSTPQRVGGGIAFGPSPRKFVNKVNRKARRRALRCVLAEHARRGTLGIVAVGDFADPSTKKAFGGLADFGNGRALLVTAREGEENAVKSFRNIADVEVRPSDNVAVADIVRAARLILTPASLERLTEIAQPPTASSHTERQEVTA